METVDTSVLTRLINEKGMSLIPLKGKVPTAGNGWQRFCREKNTGYRPNGSNAGVCCGPASGVTVFDVDWVKGVEAIARANDLDLPETFTVQTGSDKPHLYYQWWQSCGNKSLKHPAAHKLTVFDVKGDGGQVVAPGSVHPDTGKAYRVVKDVLIAPAPAWLQEFVAGKRQFDLSPLWDMPLPNEAWPKYLEGLKCSPEIKGKIQGHIAKGDRSEAIFSVLLSLLGHGYGVPEIRLIFLTFPIGEKWRVDARGSEQWLEKEIERARNKLGVSNKNHSSLSSGDDSDLEDYNPVPWPKLDPAALPGVVGRFVELATRESEADPAAVLATLLCRFGAECFVNEPRRGPVYYVGESRHHPRLFCSIVGPSGEGRKGTSAKPVQTLFDFEALKSKAIGKNERGLVEYEAPLDLYTTAICTGGPLSTGEGLAYAVRDPRQEWQVDKKTKEGCYVDVDPGVEDKRLFVLDEELAAMLRCTKREGNTISEAVRSFWDNGCYSPLTKANRVTTTNAHVCLTTHITFEELKSVLDDVQTWNGFANRFLWVCSRRQKYVAFPPPLPKDELRPIQDEVLNACKFAQEVGVMRMLPEARELWASTYQNLATRPPGLVGVVTQRAAPQTLRLAMLYALIDGCMDIDAPHLQSALAFWRYCEQSALFIFGGQVLDATSQKIVDALKAGPMTATEINKSLSGHVTAKKLKSVLKELEAAGKIVADQEKTEGRPKTIFRLK